MYSTLLYTVHSVPIRKISCNFLVSKNNVFPLPHIMENYIAASGIVADWLYRSTLLGGQPLFLM